MTCSEIGCNSSAVARWKDLVVRRREQFAARRAPGNSDLRDASFRVYANRLNELSLSYEPHGPLWDLLLDHFTSLTTVLDVGSGPGRYTLPLAQIAARVVAVEPSPVMLACLRQNLAARGLQNVDVVDQPWGDADAGIADVVICSHVLYDVDDVEGFLHKLDEHAARLCVVVQHVEQFDPLIRDMWRRLYGEEREPFTVFADLLAVLRELGIPISGQTVLPSSGRMSYESLEEAVDYCGGHLGLAANSRERECVRDYLSEVLEPVDGRLYGPPSTIAGVVWWSRLEGTAR